MLANFLQLNWRVVVIIIVALVVYYVLDIFGRKMWVSAVLKKVEALPRSPLVKAELKQRVETLSLIIIKTGKTIVIVIAGVMVLAELGINIGPLLAGAGIVGIAIGFGAQSLVKDLLSGIFIILEHQYAPGDRIELGEVQGRVQRLSLRTTILRDDNGVEHYIPNGTITRVSNYSKQWAKLNLTIPIPYKNSVDAVIELLTQVVTELSKEEHWQEVLLSQPRVLGLERFDDKSMIFKIDGQVVSTQQRVIRRELRLRIKKAFDAADISMV